MEDPLTRDFRYLHAYLLSFHDINDVDTLQFITPFLNVITSSDTNGEITGECLTGEEEGDDIYWPLSLILLHVYPPYIL
jgi:hypothetical protein